MKHVAGVRKEMGIPTVFNLLGPMSNPAKPTRVVVGVHSPEIGALMANALHLTGIEDALVVCGRERLDEVCCSFLFFFFGSWIFAMYYKIHHLTVLLIYFITINLE